MKNLPKLIFVEDYHEFDLIQSYLNRLGFKLFVEELGMIGADYVAIVYEKKDEAYETLIEKTNVS